MTVAPRHLQRKKDRPLLQPRKDTTQSRKKDCIFFSILCFVISSYRALLDKKWMKTTPKRCLSWRKTSTQWLTTPSRMFCERVVGPHHERTTRPQARLYFSFLIQRCYWIQINLKLFEFVRFCNSKFYKFYLYKSPIIKVAVNFVKRGWSCQPSARQPFHRTQEINTLLQHGVTTQPDTGVENAIPPTHTHDALTLSHQFNSAMS